MAATRILICGGRVLDPVAGLDEKANVFVSDGIIQEITQATPPADRIIAADGLLVCPGLIDMHVHLREPGQEHKEDLASGTAAALAGGFTAVACMPNTRPPLDEPELVRVLRQKASSLNRCRVFPIACLSRGRMGKQLVDFEGLSSAGAVAFSDDGDGLADDGLMREALRLLSRHSRIAIQHCEDPRFPRGVLHEGAVSASLGLPGLSPQAEERMIERDLALSAEQQARYHVAHISTAKAVDLVRQAKARGVRVTTEVCPQHLLLTDEACRALDADYKMHPPLRPRQDVDACIAGIIDGTIDMLVTDHAPHTPDEKALGFLKAPPGIIGLETAVPLFVKALIEPGHITWLRLVELMSSVPARLFNIPGGSLTPGISADITIIDPEARWVVDVNHFRSKSRNCPFDGLPVVAQVRYTLVNGDVRFECS